MQVKLIDSRKCPRKAEVYYSSVGLVIFILDESNEPYFIQITNDQLDVITKKVT